MIRDESKVKRAKGLGIALSAEPQAPEWIRLLPLGEVRLVDGRGPWRLDEAGAAAILAAWAERQTDLVIDYEHQSLTGQEAPAAGWIKDLKLAEDGLWVRVEWTARARRYIAEREYRYFSPVVEIGEEGRIVGLVNAALTNTPAMAEVPALAAKATEADRAAQAERARRYGIGIKEGGHVTKPAEWAEVPDAMFADPVNYRYPCHTPENARAAWSYWHQEGNRRQYTEAEQQIITKRIITLAKNQGITLAEENMKEKLVQLLRLTPEAGEEAILAAVAQMGDLVHELGKVLDLEQPTPGKVKGAVLALKAGQDRLGVVEQELQALKAAQQQERARREVEAAVQAGKLTPAQREWALSYATSDPEGFAAYVAAAPVVVPVGPPAGAAPVQGSGGLSAAELAMCKAVGITAEQFMRQRQKEASYGS